MRSHPLKGVEPELFSPEELLGGARRPLPSTSRPAFTSQAPPQTQQPIHRSDSDTSDRQSSGSWFQLPWRLSPQDDAPHSRRISREDRGQPLHQPPLVGCLCLSTCDCTLPDVLYDGCDACDLTVPGVKWLPAQHKHLLRALWVQHNAIRFACLLCLLPNYAIDKTDSEGTGSSCMPGCCFC